SDVCSSDLVPALPAGTDAGSIAANTQGSIQIAHWIAGIDITAAKRIRYPEMITAILFGTHKAIHVPLLPCRVGQAVQVHTIMTAGREAHLIDTGAGHDTHHTGERMGTVQRRTGATHDLHPLDPDRKSTRLNS